MNRLGQMTVHWLAAVGVMVALPVAAKDLMHTWTLTQETEAGHMLVLDESKKGQEVIATIGAEQPLGESSPPEVFDAHIALFLKNVSNVHDRVDWPREVLWSSHILYTSVHYRDARQRDRIVLFAGYAQDNATSLRIVRADGPHKPKLMTHYADDVMEFAKRPEQAIAGQIALGPHDPVMSPTPTPSSSSESSLSLSSSSSSSLSLSPSVENSPDTIKTTALPTRPGANFVKGGNQSWGYKSFSDAVRWWVNDFNNIISHHYYSITLYDPQPLNGQSVGDWLKARARGQEKHFYKTIERGGVKPWKPFWFNLYNVYEDKNGNDYGAQYTAVQVGPDSARMVRYLLTERGYRKQFRDQNVAIQSYMLKSADQAFMQPRIDAHQRELAKAREEKERLAAQEAERKRVATAEEAERERQKAQAKAERDAELATRWTAPGEGLQLTDIQAITHHTDYEASAYGGVDVSTTTWLLLKDGSAYSEPWIPPSDFNVEASRKVEPGRWTTWKKEGGKYYRGSEGNWRKIPGAVVSPGTRRQVSFRGRYIRAWGGMGLGGGVKTRSMNLYADGTFRTSASNMMSGPGPTGATSYVSTGPDGKTTVGSNVMQPFLLNKTSSTQRGGANNRGTYAIDGYTIEFLTEAGHTRRWIYYEHYKGSARVGSTDYLEEKSK